MTIGFTSAPILALITSLMNFTSHWLISFIFMAKGYLMVATPRKSVSRWTRFLRHAHFHYDPFFGRPYRPPQNLADPYPGTSTSAFPVSSKLTPSNNRWVKAAPLGLYVAAAKGSAYSCKVQCLGNLIKIALYFCLRPCEYMKTNPHKHTNQFRLCDMQFHDARGLLPTG